MRFSASLKYCLLSVLLFCGITGLKAQQNDSNLNPKPEGYIASYWNNSVRLLTSPGRWTGDDWARFGGSIAISSVVVSMDEAISQPFFDWQTDFANHFGDAGNVVGNAYLQFSITGLALGAGAITH